MQWADGIAVQLMEVCLDDHGRLRRNEYAEALVQAALLLDLQRADRLELSDDKNWIDTSPTGFTPADNLLAAVEADPDRTTKYWIGKGPRPMPALVAWLVDNNMWRLTQPAHRGRPACYEVICPDESTFDERMIFYNRIADGAAAPTSSDATVTCLALLSSGSAPPRGTARSTGRRYFAGLGPPPREVDRPRQIQFGRGARSLRFVAGRWCRAVSRSPVGYPAQ